MRWGFLGIGRVTDRMASLVNNSPDHQLVLATGRDPEKLHAWALKFHPARTTTDFMAACRDPEIDAVYIALPLVCMRTTRFRLWRQARRFFARSRFA